MDEQRYWRTDLTSNLVDDLDHAALLSSLILNDARKLKWFILALHCSTQSAYVCSLRGAHTSLLPLLTKESQKYYRAIIKGKLTSAKTCTLKLASFLDLYERVADPAILPSPSTLPKSARHTFDMQVLNSTLRNTFQHFSDDSLSVEISGLPRITESACEIIEHLAVKFRTMGFRISDAQRASLEQCLGIVRSNAGALPDRISSSSNA